MDDPWCVGLEFIACCGHRALSPLLQEVAEELELPQHVAQHIGGGDGEDYDERQFEREMDFPHFRIGLYVIEYRNVKEIYAQRVFREGGDETVGFGDEMVVYPDGQKAGADTEDRFQYRVQSAAYVVGCVDADEHDGRDDEDQDSQRDELPLGFEFEPVESSGDDAEDEYHEVLG